MQILSRLENNLKAEQRAVSEQEYVTFKHLLTPLQAMASCPPLCALPEPSLIWMTLTADLLGL